MARRQKTTQQRIAGEARRRRDAAARVAACGRKRAAEQAARIDERTAAVVAEIRRLELDALRRALQHAAARNDAERRLAAALAVTDEFAWKPWGYETVHPQTTVLSVPTLRVILSAPQRDSTARARQRFDTAVRQMAVAA